jgi:hypothetical protein
MRVTIQRVRDQTNGSHFAAAVADLLAQILAPAAARARCRRAAPRRWSRTAPAEDLHTQILRQGGTPA